MSFDKIFDLTAGVYFYFYNNTRYTIVRTWYNTLPILFCWFAHAWSPFNLSWSCRVDIHTHPYTTAACAAGVVANTADRDSLRYAYNGTRRVRQLALRCESNWVKSTHDAYENTWKCGELKLYFSPSAGGWEKKKKLDLSFSLPLP